MSNTPVTRKGLKQFDRMTPEQAILNAWTQVGGHPNYHRKMQLEVRDAMPLLARALDRLVDSA